MQPRHLMDGLLTKSGIRRGFWGRSEVWTESVPSLPSTGWPGSSASVLWNPVSLYWQKIIAKLETGSSEAMSLYSWLPAGLRTFSWHWQARWSSVDLMGRAFNTDISVILPVANKFSSGGQGGGSLNLNSVPERSLIALLSQISAAGQGILFRFHKEGSLLALNSRFSPNILTASDLSSPPKITHTT